MTTLPDRLPYIEIIIKSILNQSRPLDAFYLHIPYKTRKGKSYKIPEDFLKGLDVIINRCDKDYGPATKLIPILSKETDPNTYIITFDDDMYIHKDVVKLLIKGIKRHPNACLSFSGWCVGHFPFYGQYIFSSSKDVKVDWIQGTHTILYRRDYLDEDELLSCNDVPYIEMNDDHLIGYYLEKKGINKIVLAGDTHKLFKNMNHSSMSALSGRISLLKELVTICTYIRNKGMYNRNISLFYSISLYCIVGLVVMLCIMIYVKDWIMKISLFGVIFMIGLIFYSYYRPSIILGKEVRK